MFDSSQVSLAKFLMNLMPRDPTYNPELPKNESIKHLEFTKLSRELKDKLLLKFSESHYLSDQRYPFDHFSAYFGISLETLFSGKKILDLGCLYGGKSVSYAERWAVKEMHGIDVDDEYIRACKLYSQKRDTQVKYNFEKSFAEDLPFPDNYFQGIVSFDVLEHVQSLSQTFSESHRVLKSGGLFLAVFPPFYMPTELHLTLVTSTPCLHWFFRPKILMRAYNQIIQSRPPSDSYWYYEGTKKEYDWATIHGGIGINGTTIDILRDVLQKSNFSEYKILKPPLLSVGQSSLDYPHLTLLSRVIRPLTKLRLFEEWTTQRIVLIMRK